MSPIVVADLDPIVGFGGERFGIRAEKLEGIGRLVSWPSAREER